MIVSHLFCQFRRYHQSDIVLQGRSRIKEGWWAGGMEVQVHGQPALIKRYDDAKVNASKVSDIFRICSSGVNSFQAMDEGRQDASKPVVSTKYY